MSTQQEFELLVDIAKLLKKHGSEAFEKLAQTLSSPDSSQQLAAILSATAKAGRGIGGARPSERAIRPLLAGLARTEPERSALLLKLYDDLKAKRVLPTLRDCQAFAADNGLPLIEAATRNKAVDSLVEAAVSLPKDRVEALVTALQADTPHDDRGLEGWARIILNNDHRPKKAAQ